MPNKTFWHLMAFSQSAAIGATNASIALVPDSSITRSAGNNALLPEASECLYAFGLGVGLNRMRLNCSTLRKWFIPSLVPVNIGAVVPTPYNLVDLREKYIPLPAMTEVRIETTNTDAGAQIHNALLAVAFKKEAVPAGPVLRMRATTTVATAVGAWTLSALTLDDTLAPGKYALVGAHVEGTGLLAARFVIPGCPYRPGVVGNALPSGIPSNFFSDLSMGKWGEFNHVNIPQLESIAATIGDVDAVYMDLVQMSDNPNMV